MRLAPAALAVAVVATACGGSRSSSTSGTSTRTSATTRAAPAPKPKPAFPTYPQLVPGATATGVTPFVPAAAWQGRTAARLARTPGGVSLLAFDQRLVKLSLHSGTIDAGGAGWRYGPSVGGLERKRLVAAFNGGFRLNVGAGGFESYGRDAVPLSDGLASVVTYTDGATDIGDWHRGVPVPGRGVASVRQNLTLLVDHGRPADNLGCVECWGATLGGVSDPARSALGITANGTLVWAGGEHLTPAALAGALVSAHVARAVELDINPEWVAGYLYNHHHGRGPVTAVAVIPDQNGIPGQFLAPWSRDFFAVSAR
jgi:hypothetical protein